jgi:hypothetical protein
MRWEGTDVPVVAMKPGSAGGGKGRGSAAEDGGQAVMGGAGA